MIAEREKTVGSTTAQKNNQHSEGYSISHDQSRDLACWLYPYRLKSRVPQVAPESVSDDQESKNQSRRIPEPKKAKNRQGNLRVFGGIAQVSAGAMPVQEQMDCYVKALNQWKL